MSTQNNLVQMTKCINRANADFRAMNKEAESLYMAGIWRATPKIRWRSNQRMTLRFPKVKGQFQGPDNKEYLYIGKDEEKQEAAKKKMERTRRFYELDEKRKKLGDWLRERERESKRLLYSWSRWPT